MDIVSKVRMIADGEFEAIATLSTADIMQICRDLRAARYSLDMAEQERDQYKEALNSRSICMGVGDGSGKLFVCGDYDSIKAAQAMVFELESLRAQLKAAAEQEPVLHQVKMGVTHVACFRTKDAAQEVVDEENKRHALSGSWANYTVHPLYAAPITSALSRAVAVPDNFNGDDRKLIECATALLELDAKGVLIPHGLGGHARTIIESFVARASKPSPRITEQELSILAAVAKSPSWADIKIPSDIETADQFYGWLKSCRSPQRITEQDAREIAVSIFGYVGIGNFTAAFNSWFNDMGGCALLDKLNGVKNETN